MVDVWECVRVCVVDECVWWMSVCGGCVGSVQYMLHNITI